MTADIRYRYWRHWPSVVFVAFAIIAYYYALTGHDIIMGLVGAGTLLLAICIAWRTSRGEFARIDAEINRDAMMAKAHAQMDDYARALQARSAINRERYGRVRERIAERSAALDEQMREKYPRGERPVEVIKDAIISDPNNTRADCACGRPADDEIMYPLSKTVEYVCRKCIADRKASFRVVLANGEWMDTQEYVRMKRGY